MRILFDTRVIQDHFPGIGRYAYGLLSALPAQLDANETLVALRDPSTRNTRFDLTRLSHPRLEWIERRAPIFHPANLLRAPITDAGAALFHYPYYVRPYLGRLRSVTTLYDAISLVYPQLAPSASRRLLIRILTDLAVRASTAFVTISQASARDIARHWPATRGRITVTPLAADACFTPQPADRCAAARTKYDLPEDFTLYLASNKPHKNLVRLIEAWAMLNADSSAPKSTIQNPKSHILVIAGHQDPRYPQAQARAGAGHCGSRPLHRRGEQRRHAGAVLGLRAVRLSIAVRRIWVDAAGGNGLRRAAGLLEHVVFARGGRRCRAAVRPDATGGMQQPARAS